VARPTYRKDRGGVLAARHSSPTQNERGNPFPGGFRRAERTACAHPGARRRAALRLLAIQDKARLSTHPAWMVWMVWFGHCHQIQIRIVLCVHLAKGGYTARPSASGCRESLRNLSAAGALLKLSDVGGKDTEGWYSLQREKLCPGWAAAGWNLSGITALTVNPMPSPVTDDRLDKRRV